MLMANRILGICLALLIGVVIYVYLVLCVRQIRLTMKLKREHGTLTGGDLEEIEKLRGERRRILLGSIKYLTPLILILILR